MVACFDQPSVEIATLVRPITAFEDLANVNKPKVVINSKEEAIYFSRQPIPYFRGKDIKDWLAAATYFNHIGIYGYRADVLKELTKLPVSNLEKIESLEQLRWIDNGYRIKTAVSNHVNDAIDTPDDLEAIKKKYFQA